MTALCFRQIVSEVSSSCLRVLGVWRENKESTDAWRENKESTDAWRENKESARNKELTTRRWTIHLSHTHKDDVSSCCPQTYTHAHAHEAPQIFRKTSIAAKPFGTQRLEPSDYITKAHTNRMESNRIEESLVLPPKSRLQILTSRNMFCRNLYMACIRACAHL